MNTDATTQAPDVRFDEVAPGYTREVRARGRVSILRGPWECKRVIIDPPLGPEDVQVQVELASERQPGSEHVQCYRLVAKAALTPSLAAALKGDALRPTNASGRDATSLVYARVVREARPYYRGVRSDAEREQRQSQAKKKLCAQMQGDRREALENEARDALLHQLREHQGALEHVWVRTHLQLLTETGYLSDAFFQNHAGEAWAPLMATAQAASDAVDAARRAQRVADEQLAQCKRRAVSRTVRRPEWSDVLGAAAVQAVLDRLDEGGAFTPTSGGLL